MLACLRYFAVTVVALLCHVPASIAYQTAASRPAATGSPTVKPTATELKAIIADADDNWNVIDQLRMYPPLTKKLSVGSVYPEGSGFVGSLLISTRPSRQRYVIVERLGWPQANGPVVEVITYDQFRNLYLRWRLLPSGDVSEMIGLSNVDTKTPSARAMNRRDTISWTAPSTGGATDIATETLETIRDEAGTLVLGSMSWQRVLLRDGKVEERGQFTSIGRGGPRAAPSDLAAATPQSGKRSLIEEMFSGLLGDKKTGTPNSDREVYEFKDMNFRFTSPGRTFVKMDAKRVNPDATLVLMNSVPFQLDMVIAEKLTRGAAINVDQLVEFAKASLASGNPGTVFGAVEDVTQNGIRFKRFTSTSQGQEPVSRCHTLTVQNGFAYQILTVINGKRPSGVLRAGSRSVAGFELIDRDLVPEDAVPDYKAPALGISASFAKAGGLIWPLKTLQQDYYSATFGTQFPDGTYLVVVPTDLTGLEVEDEALVSGMMSAIGVRYPDDVRATANWDKQTVRGKQFTAIVRDSADESVPVKMRIVRNGDVAVTVAAFGVTTADTDWKQLESLLDNVDFAPPLSRSERSKLSPEERRGDTVLNEIGITLYESGDYDRAGDFFAEAAIQQPLNLQYHLNQIDSLEAGGDLKGALAVAVQQTKHFPDEAAILMREASLLSQVDRQPEAVAKYKLLFANGLRDEDHLFNYLSTLVDLGQAEDATTAIEDFLKSEPAPSVRVRRWHRQMLFETDRIDEAIAVARKLADEFPDIQELNEDYIETLVDAEKADQALKAIAKQKAAGRESIQLTYLEGLAFFSQKEYAKAKATFEKALKEAPGDSTLLEMISQTSAILGQGDNSSIKQRLQPVPIPDLMREQLSQIPLPPMEPGFSKRFVQAVTGLYFKKGEPRRQTEYRTIHVINQAGVEEQKTIRCYFDPTYERAFVNQLDVLNELGEKVASGRVDDYYLTSYNSTGMATTEAVLCAPVPGLKPGYTLQYVLTVEQKAPAKEITFENSMFAASSPGGARAYFVTGEVSNLKGISEHAQFQSHRTTDAAWWILPEPPRLYLESYMPALSDYVPSLSVGNGSDSWSQIGEKYLADLAKFLRPDSAAASLAKQLVATTDSNNAKAITILQWIRDGLVYQAIEFGSRAQIPNEANRILANRYGDCKDHSLLAYQMLQAVGVRCHLAVVNTAGNIRREFPSLDQFDHMIIYLPEIDGGRFVDLTAKNQHVLWSAASSMSDFEALVLESKAVRFRKIEQDEATLSRFVSTRDVKVDAEARNFVVTETLTVSGNAGASFRSFFRNTNAADHQTTVQDMLGANQRIEIESLDVADLEDLQKPIRVTMTYRIRRALRSLGATYASHLPAVWEHYYMQQPATTERHNPFQLTDPLRFESTVRLHVPPQMALDASSLPEGKVQTKWLTCESHRDVRGNVVEYRTTVTQPKGMFPKSEYRGFTAAVEDALDMTRPPLRLTSEQ